jgi:hypothetical protein
VNRNETGNCGDKQYRIGKGFRGRKCYVHLCGTMAVSKDRVDERGIKEGGLMRLLTTH